MRPPPRTVGTPERVARSAVAHLLAQARRPLRLLDRQLERLERRALAPVNRRRAWQAFRDLEARRPFLLPPPARPTGPVTFSYDGPVYVRPVGRGVVLGTAGDPQAEYLDEAVERIAGGDGDGHVRLELVWCPPPAPPPSPGSEAAT